MEGSMRKEQIAVEQRAAESETTEALIEGQGAILKHWRTLLGVDRVSNIGRSPRRLST